ncbi:sn-1-specific diacylglycerol lipase ABHD11-like isoform X3 [Dermacentor variabilis]|uniref:sn-1-specific diacylglycerol lipase ABHD11-like isoform X3 n=1 Tax=Dermacentor variabilis TaxID=34621 RepID=UPI003F5C6B14
MLNPFCFIVQGRATSSMAVTRGLQLARSLWTTTRRLASASLAQCHATMFTSRRMCMGWRRLGVARYCSQPRDGAVRLSYTLHESDDAATASTLPPIVALHALFGRKENMAAVSKALAAATGRNPSAVERLVAVDVAPSALPHDLISVWLPWQINAMEHILSLLSPDMSLDQALQLADEYLSREVTKPYVRRYMLANLRKGPRTFEWQANLKVIRQKLEMLGDAHYLNNKISHVEALFISADRSVYITDENTKAIKQTFPESRVVTIKGANHWVYNDKREEFVDLVRDFMAARRPESQQKTLSAA